MDFGMTLDWQRCNNDEIKRLAAQGDLLAKRLIASYVALYNDRLNTRKQSEWMKYCDEFCRRDLINTERRELERQFGHKITSERNIGRKKTSGY